MVKTLERALAEVATLPEAAQEDIGQQLPAHVERLRKLKADLEQATKELEAGEGRELDIDEFLTRMHKMYGKA
jgi:hypothetical protein